MSLADLWGRHDDAMLVGVIDVGSNTVRLVVTRKDETVLQRRALVRLGEGIERTGSISELKLAETAHAVADFARLARKEGAERVEVLVTSPGRQAANGEDLLERLTVAARVPVRLLSAAEEGRLAFLGAVEKADAPLDRIVAVCDVGGGSAQITVGMRDSGAAWTRSIDIGSMRLTSRLLPADPPGEAAVVAARAEVARYLEPVMPPLPHTAYAVGGSARALRSLVGSDLGKEELEQAIALLTVTPTGDLIGHHDLNPDRVHTLTAGAIILAAIQERVGVPLRVARGGIREGAALEIRSQLAAA
jgi:exopolyphosphatase / guanosine-5'-triphosphate,3'-diphosphate pyrophosphatase